MIQKGSQKWSRKWVTFGSPFGSPFGSLPAPLSDPLGLHFWIPSGALLDRPGAGGGLLNDPERSWEHFSFKNQ